MAGGGDGHYCALDMEYARWFSRPQVLFQDDAFHRVMYRVAFDQSKVKRVRFVMEGTEHVINDGGIVLLSCLMKPNFPPVEHTEERFHDWNPQLEIRPSGCEDFEVPAIVNPRAEQWGDWEDYYKREKTRPLHLAAANRTSRWMKGFGQAEPQSAEPERVRYTQPDVWIPRIFEANNVVSMGVNWGWRCVCCTFDADQA